MSGLTSSSPINVGVIGLSEQGWATWSLIPSMLQPPLKESYTLVSLCTTKYKSSQSTAKRFSDLIGGGHLVKALHGDPRQLIYDPLVTLVVVSVKAPHLFGIAMEAVEAGKNVMVEWPVGRNLDQVIAIEEAVVRKGIRMMVGLQGMHSPTLKTLVQMGRSGQLGKVISSTVIGSVPADFGFWGPQVNERNLYTSEKHSGGTMLNLSLAHFLHAFTSVLGQIAYINASFHTQHAFTSVMSSPGTVTKTIPQNTPDQIILSGLTKSHVNFSIHWRGGVASSNSGNTPFLWLIDTTKHTIKLSNDSSPGGAYIHIKEPQLYLDGRLVDVPKDNLGNVGRAWFEFGKSRATENDCGHGHATIRDAVKLHRLLDAIERSAVEHRRVYVE